jgi:hypothetical protein
MIRLGATIGPLLDPRFPDRPCLKWLVFANVVGQDGCGLQSLMQAHVACIHRAHLNSHVVDLICYNFMDELWEAISSTSCANHLAVHSAASRAEHHHERGWEICLTSAKRDSVRQMTRLVAVRAQYHLDLWWTGLLENRTNASSAFAAAQRSLKMSVPTSGEEICDLIDFDISYPMPESLVNAKTSARENTYMSKSLHPFNSPLYLP